MVHAQLAFPFCFRSVCLHIRFSHALNVLFFLLQRLVLHCSTLTSNLCCVVLSSILGSQFWCRVSVHRFDMGKRNVKSLKFNPFPRPKERDRQKSFEKTCQKKEQRLEKYPLCADEGCHQGTAHGSDSLEMQAQGLPECIGCWLDQTTSSRSSST